MSAKRIVMKDCLTTWCWAVAALFCLAASLPGRPVDALRIQGEDGRTWHAPVPLGQTVTTWYRHSVERTLVADSYYPISGRLHQWRTRSRSHNAGLPWKTPEHGRFLTEGDWLVLEGGLPAWESIRLRVGNERLGRNELQIGQGPLIPLYKRCAGKVLCLSSWRIPGFFTWPAREQDGRFGGGGGFVRL